MRLAYTAGLITAISLTAATGFAQDERDFSKVEIGTTPLGHGVYELNGQGANVTVACGQDGAIQVDTEFAGLHDKIKAATDRVCVGKPVKYLINSIFHADHSDGNAAFAKDGAVIVGHENLKLRLEHGVTYGVTGTKKPPVGKDALPTKTYTESLQLMVQGQTGFVSHPKSANTDGDSYVYFPAANVIATGDIVVLGRYVTVDYPNGGSINGIIQTVDTLIRMGNDETKYIPGHGPVASRADLQRYRDLLVRIRDTVQALITAGKTEDEAVAEKPLAQIGAELHTSQMADEYTLKQVYRSLKGAKANKA